MIVKFCQKRVSGNYAEREGYPNYKSEKRFEPEHCNVGSVSILQKVVNAEGRAASEIND